MNVKELKKQLKNIRDEENVSVLGDEHGGFGIRVGELREELERTNDEVEWKIFLSNYLKENRTVDPGFFLIDEDGLMVCPNLGLIIPEHRLSLSSRLAGKSPIKPNLKARLLIIIAMIGLVAILTLLTWLTGVTTPI